MIPALFALSAAMVIGGIAAVIQGFPFVRLESGLSMVIAGSTVASAGAVLAGLGVVALNLRRVAHAFDARRIVDAVGAMRDDVRAPPMEAPMPAGEPAPVSWPQTDPAPAAALSPRPSLPRFLTPGPEVGLLGGQSRNEPAFDSLFADPAIEPVHAEPLHAGPVHAEPQAPDVPAPEVHVVSDPREPELPLPIPAAEPEPTHAPEPRAEPEPEPVVAATPPAHHDAPEADHAGPALRSSLDGGEHDAPAEPARQEREVVGRYASGGNTYVMFADGSIEAETPRGRFTFNSLDELKAFVEAGGESGRGAA